MNSSMYMGSRARDGNSKSVAILAPVPFAARLAKLLTDGHVKSLIECRQKMRKLPPCCRLAAIVGAIGLGIDARKRENGSSQRLSNCGVFATPGERPGRRAQNGNGLLLLPLPLLAQPAHCAVLLYCCWPFSWPKRPAENPQHKHSPQVFQPSTKQTQES